AMTTLETPRFSLAESLAAYAPHDNHEAAMVARFRAFLASLQNPHDAFARELAGDAPDWGHVTGSAWSVSRDAQRVVLVHHAKLGRWLQPGGHCDGDADVLAVALREAREETGLEVAPRKPGIFDVDVHSIPEYW